MDKCLRERALRAFKLPVTFFIIFCHKRRSCLPTRHQSDSTGKICNKSDPNTTITKMKSALCILLFATTALARCPMSYIPVCGMDGNTYPNKCVARRIYAQVSIKVFLF